MEKKRVSERESEILIAKGGKDIKNEIKEGEEKR